jgi:hypothetical protein
MKFLLDLSMKCWVSAFNAQGSKVIIVVLQVRAVKIYVVAVVKALRKKENQDETQFTTKIDGFLSFNIFLSTFLWHNVLLMMMIISS